MDLNPSTPPLTKREEQKMRPLDPETNICYIKNSSKRQWLDVAIAPKSKRQYSAAAIRRRWEGCYCSYSVNDDPLA